MMADSKAKISKQVTTQATHRIQMTPAAFQAMSLALHNLSVRKLEACSPRRMLTHVLTDTENPLFKLNFSELDEICHPESLFGSVRVNIRLDSVVNDRLRVFREHAEQQVGRSVSVLEAINACIYVINRR